MRPELFVPIILSRFHQPFLFIHHRNTMRRIPDKFLFEQRNFIRFCISNFVL